MKHTCIIIDDEPIAIEVIRNHLQKLDDLEVLASFTDPIKALKFIRENQPALIFLDIEMPVISGFELLETLAHSPKVIITTAHRDFAPEAFNFNVLDYLLKPISFERLLRSVNKFMESVSENSQETVQAPQHEEEHLIIKAGKKFHKLQFSDITYIESMDDFIRIHTLQDRFDSYERLLGMEQKLPSETFIRIHRSYIINIDFVQSFTASSLDIRERTLVIGKSYRESVLPLLQK